MTKSTSRIGVIIAIAMMFLIGCSSTSIVRPDNSNFSGIAPSLAGKTNTTLILMHGMCDKDVAWFDKFATELGKASNFRVVAPTNAKLSTNKQIAVFNTRLTSGTESIDMYGLSFSPATRVYKSERLCRDIQTESKFCKIPGYTGERARVNKFLKDKLLNDCLADVVIYSGPTGKAIRVGIREALEDIYQMRVSSNSGDDPVGFIAESLGSKIMRDALICIEDDTPEGQSARLKGLAMLTYSNSFFLLANQIPLLNAGVQIDCKADPKFLRLLPGELSRGDISDVLRLLPQLGKRDFSDFSFSSALPKPRKLVAFSDPNDVLSYSLYPEDYDEIEVINVEVDNATSWFGLIDNPVAAHTGYKTNKSVIKHIFCGYGRDAPIEKCN